MPPSKEKTAELIKSQRLAKGFTQQQLAELTRVSLRSIQRIENGEVIPRAYTLTILAEHLDFDPQNIRSSTNPNNTETVLKSNKAKRIIFSAGLGIIMLLLSAAFLSQAPHFPETNFESFIFWAGITIAYAIILIKIWK